MYILIAALQANNWKSRPYPRDPSPLSDPQPPGGSVCSEPLVPSSPSPAPTPHPQRGRGVSVSRAAQSIAPHLHSAAAGQRSPGAIEPAGRPRGLSSCRLPPAFCAAGGGGGRGRRARGSHVTRTPRRRGGRRKGGDTPPGGSASAPATPCRLCRQRPLRVQAAGV